MFDLEKHYTEVYYTIHIYYNILYIIQIIHYN